MRSLFNQNAPEQARLNLSAAPKPRRQLIDQYRPSCLDELHGQEPIVASLRAFCANPTSKAFLFHGPTGTGKTSAAHALCGELGVDLGSNWFYVRSGTADAELAERIIDGFRFAPWGDDTAWRVVLVDEADTATPKAKQLWLSILESLPERTVIIFTTNHIDKFDARTIHRFQPYEFKADDLAGVQAAVDAVWKAETGGTDGPTLDQLPGVVVNGQASTRHAIQVLEAVIRDGLVLLPPSPVFLESTANVIETASSDTLSVVSENREDTYQVGPMDQTHSSEIAAILCDVSPMPSEGSGADNGSVGGNGMELLSDSNERASYADGRTIPIVGDDVHCHVGDDWRIVGRVVERDGVTLVRLETGDVLPLDEDWSVCGEGLDNGESDAASKDDSNADSSPRGNDRADLLQRDLQAGTDHQARPEVLNGRVPAEGRDGQAGQDSHLPGRNVAQCNELGRGSSDRVLPTIHSRSAEAANAVGSVEPIRLSVYPDGLTPAGIFLNVPALCGGAPEHPTELVIKGTTYSVERLGIQSYRLSKEGSDSVYDVEWTAAKGATCNCPDFERRHAELQGQSEGCKHVKSLRSVKLIPAMPTTPAKPFPVAKTADEIAPMTAEVTEAMIAIKAGIIDRLVSGMDETTGYAAPMPRLTTRGERAVKAKQGDDYATLPGLIEREAVRFDLMDSDAGELMARTLRALAADVRSHGATTVAEYEARKELQERWLMETR